MQGPGDLLLKQKITLIMGAVILAMMSLNAAVLLPVADSFSDLEEAQAEQDSARVQQAIAIHLEQLSHSARDWSHWDETYGFIAGTVPDYPAANLSVASFFNLGVDMMYFYDRAGNLVWGQAFDMESEEEVPLSHFAPGALAADDPLLENVERRSSARGIIVTEAGPVLVASSPIVTTEDDGTPANGTLIHGRFLNEDVVETLRHRTSVSFDVRTVTAGSVPPEGSVAGGFSVEETRPDVLIGRRALSDLYGQPAIEILTLTPRDITRTGDQAITLALISLAVVGVVALVVMWILLQRLVLRPLIGLTDHVLLIGETGAMDRRVPAKGKDEYGVLAREFNRMLERLADARRQLVEQSHRSGMAEMAAGVLHNLRNGLTPLVGRLEEMSRQLRVAPGSEIGRAVAEIEDPATDDERRRKLISYVSATGRSLVELNAATGAELDEAMAQARTLGEILKFQDKFIYGSSAVEPIRVGGVVLDAVKLMQPQLAPDIVIEVDRTLDGLAPVMAERITLVQVIHNLLVNAVEAIQGAGRTDGRITVSAAPAGAGTMIDLQVSDNGVGIAPSDLTRIFERGFTTKQSGAGGLGLHWSAIAIGNMQGRVFAESNIEDGSTSLHVLLPAMEERQAAE